LEAMRTQVCSNQCFNCKEILFAQASNYEKVTKGLSALPGSDID
jgi:hypothetical protein